MKREIREMVGRREAEEGENGRTSEFVVPQRPDAGREGRKQR